MSSSVEELKIDTNVVLKLDLGERGGIRRIRLGKIWDKDGVSYEKLKNVILELDSSVDNDDDEKKRVVVTYKDEDEDVITISTNEELSDAFLQFVHKVPPVLRATANISPNNKKKRRSESPPPQVVKLVDAIHDAVSNALDTAWPPRRKTPDDNDSDNTNTTTSQQHEQADTMAQKVVSNLKPENLTVHNPTPNNNNNNNNNNNKKEEDTEKETTSNNNNNTNTNDDDDDNTKSNVVEEVDWSKFDKTFIHGRHTCDGCLITPIVGIRYHANNIVDYDLCENCITKASNQKVAFQPAQLERDVPFQARWWRRQQRLELQRKQRLNFFDQQHKPNNEDDDIKEAIRLSLLSTPKKHNSSDETKQGEINSSDETKQDVVEKEERVVASLKPLVVDHDTNTQDSLSLKIESKEETDNNQTKPTVPTTYDDDETHKKKEQEEEIVETTILVTEQQPTIVSPLKQTNEKATKEVQTCTPKCCDETNYSDSSFAMDAEGSGDVAVAIGQTLDKCAEEINAIVSEIGKSSSSSSDAMSSSFTSYDSALQNHNEHTDKDAKSAADNHSIAGETILESVPDTKPKEEVDDDSWHVLENSQTIQDEMVARAASLLGSILFTSEMSQESSKDSKNNDNEEQQQAQPFESFLSTESSVPSSVPSMESDIPVTVLSRWDVELKKLHEFGFLDDVRNVQVLEKLEAANIGSDCPEHVTVSQAIGELLDGPNQKN